jgi:hypothetical protein
MTFGGVIDNSMTCLRSCVSTRKFFLCHEETDPSKRRQTTLPFVGIICDDMVC